MFISKKSIFYTLLIALSIHQTIHTKQVSLISEDEFTQLVHEAEKDQIYRQMTTKEDLVELRSVNPKKPVTFVVFIAADNDLHYFAWKNIKQMEMIGSNENVNIVIQLNTPGYFNPTKRYVVKQGRRILVQGDDFVPNQKLNSGSPYTLIDCVEWAMKHYPADELYLVLWNHGTGPHDPGIPKTINTCDLFYVNPVTNMLEIDRSTGFLDELAKSALQEVKNKGICFDETFKSYMTNQDLEFALSEIKNKVLKGKKIGFVGFDACLMSMIEIAKICKDFAKVMVGSQEVEYGTGWNYETLLRPFLTQAPNPFEFSKIAVDAYKDMYQYITPDYTQSAIDLSEISALEANIHQVAERFLYALDHQKNYSVSLMIQKSKSPKNCTCFDEPTYIDLHHLYSNFLRFLDEIKLIDTEHERVIKDDLSSLLQQGMVQIKKTVIANKAGSNLSKAQGISIYFPEHSMFHSYLKCQFALSNSWSLLVAKYILKHP